MLHVIEPSTKHSKLKPKLFLSRLVIKSRVEDLKESLVIIHNKVYNLTKWVKFHPGGELAIKHLAGATLELIW